MYIDILVGATPLHVAVQENDTIAVEYLLKYNASTNSQNDYGKKLFWIIYQIDFYLKCYVLSRWNCSPQINVQSQWRHSEDPSSEQCRS